MIVGQARVRSKLMMRWGHGPTIAYYNCKTRVSSAAAMAMIILIILIIMHIQCPCNFAVIGNYVHTTACTLNSN